MVNHSRFNAFFRFSAFERPLVAVRFTAFVPAVAVLIVATGSDTFESDTPRGAGDVRRSLLELLVVFSFSFVALLCGDDEAEGVIEVDATGEAGAAAGPLINSDGFTCEEGKRWSLSGTRLQ